MAVSCPGWLVRHWKTSIGVCTVYAGVLRQVFDSESSQFRDDPLLVYTGLLAAELGEQSVSGSIDEGKGEGTVPQVGPCPIDISPDLLPSFARWTFGSILSEKEAAIYLRIVSGFSIAKERFGVLKEQERQRDLRRLMTTVVETILKGTLTDLCARDMCAQKHYDAFSLYKRRRVLVETLVEYCLEETSLAVESLPTGDRVCHDASSESAEES